MDPASDKPAGLVFISARSADYSYADQVYRFLTSAGVPAFFSHESLPELGSSDYRRQIDTALDQAEHMIIVTSSVDNVLSSWVEAEWGFFINEKRSARKKGNLLTLVVGDLKPSSLPPSLRYYEVIPFEPGALEKILRYVRVPEPAAGVMAKVTGIAAQPITGFREVATFGEPPRIHVLAVSDRLVAAGGSDGAVRIWDTETRGLRTTLASEFYWRTLHESLITALAFSPTGLYLASGHYDGAVHVWTTDQKKEIQSFKHEETVTGVAFSPDGHELVTAGKDGALRSWNIDSSGARQASILIQRQPAPLLAITFTNDGKWLVVSLSDASARRHFVQIHDAANHYQVLAKLRVSLPISAMALSPDGQLLAGGCSTGEVMLFNLKPVAEDLLAGKLPERLIAGKYVEEHQKPVQSIVFLPSGLELASAAVEGQVPIINVQSGEILTRLRGGPNERFTSVVNLVRGYRLATGISDGRIRLWEPA